jgi:hypothetical protein
MGGGDRSPLGRNVTVNEFGDRVSESLTEASSMVIDGAARSTLSTAIEINSKVASFRGDGSVSAPASGVDYGSVYNDDSFVEVDHSDPVDPGTPVVIDHDGGEVTAVAVQHNTSGSVEVMHSDGTVETVTPGSDGGRVAEVADPSQMSDGEFTQYMKDRFTIGTDFNNVSERDYEVIVENIEEKFIDRFQSREIAEEFTEKLTNVTCAEKDITPHAITGGFDNEAMIRFGETYSNASAIHEATHALHGAYGFRKRPGMTNTFDPTTKTVKQVTVGSDNAIPDFGGEVEFGDTAPSFDEFLLTHDSGVKPGAADAHAERAVANADRGELVVNRDGSAEEFVRDVSNGDVVEVNDGSGESRVGVVTRRSTVTDTVIGDNGVEDREFEEVVVRDLYPDEPGETGQSVTVTYDSVAGEVSGGGAVVSDTGATVTGVVDKYETAREAGVDVDALQEANDVVPESIPEEMHALVSEVNKQWARTAGHKEAGRGMVADMMKIKDKYSTTSPGETMAMAFESAFTGSELVANDGRTTNHSRDGSVIRENPELAAAIDNVVALPDSKKSMLDT